MYKYNNNDLITGYIKELLHNFNLPKVHVYKKGMPITKGCLYLKDNNIVLSRSSKGISIADSDFKLSQSYYGAPITNITKNLQINGSIYDSYTHRYLGDYLRFIRDTQSIDLMPMYNCFSNEYPTNLELKVTNKVIFDTADKNYKLFMVPVKFYTNYLIGINSNLPYDIALGFYDENKQLFTNIAAGTRGASAKTSYEKFILDSYKNISNSSAINPVIYSTNFELSTYNNTSGTAVTIEDKELGDMLFKQEENLKLFIKLPIDVETSITVIETSVYNAYTPYVNTNYNIVTSSDCAYTQDDLNKLCISKLQLLNTVSTTSYPFADRLVEYLLDSAITPIDEISKNITRVQNKLLKLNKDLDLPNNTGYKIIHKGIWDPKIRLKLYALNRNVTSNTATGLVSYDELKYDMFGYVDKDVEKKLGDYSYEEYEN